MLNAASAEVSARMRAREVLLVAYATIATTFYGLLIREDLLGEIGVLGALLSLSFLTAMLHHHNAINRGWYFIAVNIDKKLKAIDQGFETFDLFLGRETKDYEETQIKMVFYWVAFVAPVAAMALLHFFGFFGLVELGVAVDSEGGRGANSYVLLFWSGIESLGSGLIEATR
jgi:hypothetical protein